MGSATSVKPRGINAELVAWMQFGIVTILVVAVYAEILIDLAREWWTRPEASYGILIPPFALYLAYLKRTETLSLPNRPDTRGLGLVAAACLSPPGVSMSAPIDATFVNFEGKQTDPVRRRVAGA